MKNSELDSPDRLAFVPDGEHNLALNDFNRGERHPMSRSKSFAMVCGLAFGGLLFLRFGWDGNVALSGWQWYQGAAFLAGFGIAGVFPETWLSGPAGLVLGPVLVESIRTAVSLSKDASYCNLFPIGLAIVFCFSLPAPIIGAGISRLLARMRISSLAFLAALVCGVAIGAVLPHIQQAKLKKLETATIPGLLRQVADAELAYKAGHADANFACDGTQLPGELGKLAWTHIGESSVRSFLIVEQYSIRLECLNDEEPRGFLVSAYPYDPSVRTSRLSIDQTGTLVGQPVQ